MFETYPSPSQLAPSTLFIFVWYLRDRSNLFFNDGDVLHGARAGATAPESPPVARRGPHAVDLARHPVGARQHTRRRGRARRRHVGRAGPTRGPAPSTARPSPPPRAGRSG